MLFKGLQEHHLSCRTMGLRSWKLKLRILLVEINRNTRKTAVGEELIFFYSITSVRFRVSCFLSA